MSARPRAPATAIGLVGVGRMGSAVAHRLLTDGIPLLMWNRTRGRAEQAATTNARVAESADEVFEGCGLVLVMVFDHAAAEEILRGNRARLARRTVALLTDVARRVPTLRERPRAAHGGARFCASHQRPRWSCQGHVCARGSAAATAVTDGAISSGRRRPSEGMRSGCPEAHPRVRRPSCRLPRRSRRASSGSHRRGSRSP
jgi:6-phosphogluconate dehydrogenase-like protein